MVRTGIATSETIGEVLENNGQHLSYGATPEAWRDALTAISGEDEEITPRQNEHVTGFASTNETILKTFNNETKGETYTVDIAFMRDGEPIRVSNPTLDGHEGIMENEHYEFGGLTGELKDVEVKFTVGDKEVTETRSYNGYTNDVIEVKEAGVEAAPITVSGSTGKAYGMKINKIQSGVEIKGNNVLGVSHYVVDFKGLPEKDPEKKKGNFLSLFIKEATEGYKVTVTPEGGSEIVLSKEDPDILYRLVEKKPITVTCEKEGEAKSTKVLDLSGVILEQE